MFHPPLGGLLRQRLLVWSQVEFHKQQCQKRRSAVQSVSQAYPDIAGSFVAEPNDAQSEQFIHSAQTTVNVQRAHMEEQTRAAQKEDEQCSKLLMEASSKVTQALINHSVAQPVCHWSAGM
jgi:hypothetical protein